jgi:hypothetical protein
VIGSNGPLAGAIVMWKNSLVFHDIDKMISLFIHIYPPIGTPPPRCAGLETSPLQKALFGEL